MAVADARKGLRLFADHDAPVLGVVENMSAFHCPECDDTHRVFGEGGAGEIRDDYDVPVVGTLPVHPDFDTERADGPTVRDDESQVQADLEAMVEGVADRVGEVKRRQVARRVGEWEGDEDDEDEETGDRVPAGAEPE
jgi:ATP-binding protein involved in chromosome partitioning